MEPGNWRLVLTTITGGFRTSHEATCPHVAPECATMFIPDHEHHVEVDLTHVALTAEYGLRPGMHLSLSLPFDVKDQSVRYTTLDGQPFTAPYGDIHHRSESLSGFSDAMLTVNYAPERWNSGSSRWILGGGLSLPLGDIVPDPMRLGMLGIKHQHLQFGTGTVYPRVTAFWSRPAAAFLLTSSLDVNLPLTENDEGFRASRSVQWSLGAGRPLGRFFVSAEAASQYQSVAHWSGVADEASGFVNGGLRLRVSTLLPRGFSLSAAGYVEAFSHALHDKVFEQKPTFSISLSRLF